MEPKKFSSEHIKNRIFTINSETLSFEDCFETKIQAKFDKSDQNFEIKIKIRIMDQFHRTTA